MAGQINKNNKYRIPKRKEENMTEEKKCPLYKKCGGCQLQNLSYAEQLGFKQRKTERLLGGFGRVEPIIGMDEPYHYRNKVQAAFRTDKNGKIISGVYQSGTHHIVGIDECMTEDVTADKIIVAVRKMLKSFKLTTYDEDKQRGFLRHILVKRGFATNEVVTSKYTFWSFLPLFLWENLNPWNKFANFYFVCVAICEVGNCADFDVVHTCVFPYQR